MILFLDNVAMNDKETKELYYKTELDYPLINGGNAFSKLADVEEIGPAHWECNYYLIIIILHFVTQFFCK